MKAEIPGSKKEDIKLSVENGQHPTTLLQRLTYQQRAASVTWQATFQFCDLQVC